MAEDTNQGRGRRYARIIEEIFTGHFTEGVREFEFERQELLDVAARLKIALPKNVGDVVYSFRYRADLPARVRSTAAVVTDSSDRKTLDQGWNGSRMARRTGYTVAVSRRGAPRPAGVMP